MSTPARESRLISTEQHSAAVARSLGWAQESAERGDYADALEWIRTVEAIGEDIPAGYKSKRSAWHRALVNCQANQDRS